MRVKLKFFPNPPLTEVGGFSYLIWSLMIGNPSKFWKSRKISNVIRGTFENANLVTTEKDSDGNVIVTYPKTTIEMDEMNIYLRMVMIAGQTGKQWESKIDAFGHSLFGSVVKSKISKGIVELTIKYNEMDTSKVLYKENSEHYLNVGYGNDGVIRWWFDNDPHMLVVGMTGTGKSTFVRNLLTQFRKEWILRIVDGKYVEFPFMRDYGYDVATDVDDFVKYVDEAQEEVDRRFRLMQAERKNNYKNLGLEPYFLLVDEFIFLADSVSTKKEDGKSKRDILFEKLRDISLRGRAGGVFLILILQRPDSTFMPTVIRDNLVCKVVLGGSETALDMAFGSEYKKLPELEMGQGYVMFQGVENFQFPNYELETFISDLEKYTGSKENESQTEIKQSGDEPLGNPL